MIVERLIALPEFFAFWIPFLLASTLTYGILRKTKLFGSYLIDGILALLIGILVGSYARLAVFPLGFRLVGFFAPAVTLALVFTIGLSMAAFFYPDLMGFLKAKMIHRTTLFLLILLGFLLLLPSGLIELLYRGPVPAPGEVLPPPLPPQIINFAVLLAVLAIMLLIATWLYREILKRE